MAKQKLKMYFILDNCFVYLHSSCSSFSLLPGRSRAKAIFLGQLKAIAP